MTIPEAVAILRPLCGDRAISIECVFNDRPRHGARQSAEFTVWIADDIGEFEDSDGLTLAEAVECAVAKLRPAPADPLAEVEAAMSDIDQE